jgi:MFS family permease
VWHVSDRKRLPVLKATPEEESGDEPRPPWHWVGFGACAIFAAWLPLTMLANAIVTRIEASRIDTNGSQEDFYAALAAIPSGERIKLEVMIALVYALALAVGAVFGGYVVGRWGGENAGVREAAIAGVATTIVVCALAWASMGFSLGPLLTFVVAVPMAAWGGRAGLKGRIKMMTPNVP